jgi:hypothetical protein
VPKFRKRTAALNIKNIVSCSEYMHQHSPINMSVEFKISEYAHQHSPIKMSVLLWKYGSTAWRTLLLDTIQPPMIIVMTLGSSETPKCWVKMLSRDASLLIAFWARTCSLSDLVQLKIKVEAGTHFSGYCSCLTQASSRNLNPNQIRIWTIDFLCNRYHSLHKISSRIGRGQGKKWLIPPFH